MGRAIRKRARAPLGLTSRTTPTDPRAVLLQRLLNWIHRWCPVIWRLWLRSSRPTETLLVKVRPQTRVGHSQLSAQHVGQSVRDRAGQVQGAAEPVARVPRSCQHQDRDGGCWREKGAAGTRNGSIGGVRTCQSCVSPLRRADGGEATTEVQKQKYRPQFAQNFGHFDKAKKLWLDGMPKQVTSSVAFESLNRPGIMLGRARGGVRPEGCAQYS